MTQERKQPLTPVFLRRRVKLTQRQASDLLGVRESTISEWERGISSPNLLLVPRIMQAYNCTADEVIQAFVALRASRDREKVLVAPNLEN
ncbi:helix-turn-helix transcriptional regulator [Microcoleus sp. herbarium12]|uniref:helix-turn-helix transcriptional regulator n=1 Tax=Microcoleus sp. herbarium12 TaxID=3055437 RepID=UPI002FD578B4